MLHLGFERATTLATIIALSLETVSHGIEIFRISSPEIFSTLPRCKQIKYGRVKDISVIVPG